MFQRRPESLTVSIILFCISVYCQEYGQAMSFNLCDIDEVIKERNGSIINNQGSDCTRIILAPQGWRIKLVLYDLLILDGVTTIHDGATRVGTLKYSFPAGHTGGGKRALTYYTSSNALLIYTAKSSSSRNKFNASFEMLPVIPNKCSCLPLENAKAKCSFPPVDNRGVFYFDNDELKKVCKTTCDPGYKIYEQHFNFADAMDTTCYLDIRTTTSVWKNSRDEKLHPKSTSCKKVIPATEVLMNFAFDYVDTHCNAINTSMIANEMKQFLISNYSNAMYVGECFKVNPENCTVNPVVVSCSGSSKNVNNAQIQIKVQDNIQRSRNDTMTRALFDSLFDDVRRNFQIRFRYFVTNTLMYNATAINIKHVGFYPAVPMCPPNYGSTDTGFLYPRKSCIPCSLHSSKDFHIIQPVCNVCPDGKRRLANESMCVNGSKVYPKLSNNNCVHTCAMGKYFSNQSGICEWCDYGFFQDSLSALNPICHKCPGDNTTSFIGARSSESCMSKCHKGQYVQHLSCYDCQVGYYMPYDGNTYRKCYKCPPGNTTLQVATVNITDCVPICSLGEYFNITLGDCVMCPNDTYQDVIEEGNARSCKSCPTNSITSSPGSTSISACIGPCREGEYLDIKSQKCMLCPLNSYNDARNHTRTICISCPKHKITLNQGSDNYSHCIYDCNEGEYFNITKEACEKCPINTYQDRVGQSSCKTCSGNTFTLKPGSKICLVPCQSGELLNKTLEACEKCPVGYYQNQTNFVSDQCLECPIDFYSDIRGNSECTPCPKGLITIATSAISISACIQTCAKGHFLNYTLKTCQKCPKGFYQAQDMYRFRNCTSCGSANLTTVVIGAKSSEQCVGYCTSSPCLNGGVCRNIERDFNCTCPSELTGKYCETIIDGNEADNMEIAVRFTSLSWKNTLNNPDTQDFMKQANQIQEIIRDAYKNDSSFRTVKVVKFLQGSVVSVLDIRYVAGTDFNNPYDILDSVAADGEIGGLAVDRSSLKILNYTCGTPLGMENGRIPDSALTSANKDNIHPFTNARLNHNGPGWTPRVYHIEDAFLQVDFGQVVLLTGIATQGSSYYRGNWLRAYSFNYSIDGKEWKEYKEGRIPHAVFNANTDVNSVVRKDLEKQVETRYVRIIQYVTSHYLSFRCEFYGCPIPQYSTLPTFQPPETTTVMTREATSTREQTSTTKYKVTEADDDESKTGLIIGLVVGFLLLFIIIIVIIYIYKKKQARAFGVDGVPMQRMKMSS